MSAKPLGKIYPNTQLFVLDNIIEIAKLATMNIIEMEKNAERAASLLQMMSNANRLMILCQLLNGEQCVMDLAKAVGLSQSALSQHLAKLRSNNLVETRRDAQTIYYSLASCEVEAVMNVLYNLYCAVDPKSTDQNGCQLTAG